MKKAGGVIGSAGTEVLPGGFDWNDERMDGMDLGRVADCPREKAVWNRRERSGGRGCRDLHLRTMFSLTGQRDRMWEE